MLARETFGVLPDGRKVEAFILASPSLRVRLMTLGASLISVQAPDRNGAWGELTLGHDTLEGYLTANPYFGSIVGRYANRIANARFTLDGTTYTLPANDGRHHLHGGPNGFAWRLWHAEVRGANAIAFSLFSPDGDEGYPGNLVVNVVYTLRDATLQIDYWALTDRPTIVNLTNHAYFNLRGAGDVLGHRFQTPADAFLPVDSELIPTGEVRSVAGTPFDFRRTRPIGAGIQAPDEQIQRAGGYDHTFLLRKGWGRLRRACKITEPESGRTLEVRTTLPGFQFYTGNFLDGSIRGRSGHAYTRWSGFCIETHYPPDAPNQLHFPSPVLRPGVPFHATTLFRFGRV